MDGKRSEFVVLCFPGSESNETQEDVYVASVETDRGVKEQLRLYDTKGLHDGQDLPKHYYSVADGFVLVYSIDSLESFKKVDVLKKEIDKSRDKKEVWLLQSVFSCSLISILLGECIYQLHHAESHLRHRKHSVKRNLLR